VKVSVVINCSAEGLLLRRSIESALRSAEASGLAEACEFIAVADDASHATRTVLQKYADRLTEVLHINSLDLGLARNAGVAAARGELILFLDGDDLWGRNWVGEAWQGHCGLPERVVLHPQYCIFFGARSELLIHSDWREPGYDPRGLVVRNHWISLCGIRRDLAREFPFPQADVARGFGFEDWSWYAQLIGHGFRHVTVPRTAHFVRLKAGDSMQKAMRGCFCIPSVAFAEYLAADDPTRPYDL
jgi:glycosyltransferase involved in cell wall biosynthesis